MSANPYMFLLPVPLKQNISLDYIHANIFDNVPGDTEDEFFGIDIKGWIDELMTTRVVNLEKLEENLKVAFETAVTSDSGSEDYGILDMDDEEYDSKLEEYLENKWEEFKKDNSGHKFIMINDGDDPFYRLLYRAMKDYDDTTVKFIDQKGVEHEINIPVEVYIMYI